MSNLCMNELVDEVWGEFCPSDDHIVPDSGIKRLSYHFILEDSNKKRHRELANSSNRIEDRSAARCADQGGDKGGIPPLSKRRNMMFTKDSWPHKADSAFTSAFDSDAVKEASSVASDSTMPSGHCLKSNKRNSNSSDFCGLDSILDDETCITDNGSFEYPMGDLTHTGNNIDCFENAENKDSSDLLYCDWPQIENFEDIDSMLRGYDSTFGLGICREEEMGWLSLDDTGGSKDVLKSDVKFPTEPSEAKIMSENHEISNDYSINNSSTTSAPFRYKDSSWTSDNSDSFSSFVIGPDVAESTDGFIPQKQEKGITDKSQPRITTNSYHKTGTAVVTNEHKSQIKLETQIEGQSLEKDRQSCAFLDIADLPNEDGKLCSGLTTQQTLQSVHMQQQHELATDSYTCSLNPISYMHPDNSHLSDPSSVNPKPFVVKTEANDSTSVSPRDSSHASSHLSYMEGSPDLGFKATAQEMCEQRKKLHCSQGNPSSVHDSQKVGSVTVQASMSAPGLGGKYENHCNAEGVSLATPAELGSSNTEESPTSGSEMDDISLEAASFRQLQLVMEQLDLRTKLCIRDSLYRLARSSEQRHNLASLDAGCGEEPGTQRFTSFMDIETDTNPIDRSVAHLLFHRPSDSPTIPAKDTFPFKSSSVVRGSVANQPALGDNLVSEENVPEVQKVS